MKGPSSKLPRAPRVADSLAGNYDALKPIHPGNKDTELTTKVETASASLQNRKSPNMGESVIGQPVTVSAKNFKKNVTISSSSHGLV